MIRCTRRGFLNAAGTASAVVSFGGLAPQFLQAAAVNVDSQRILVVIELAGGNDGLNTVVPFSNDGYLRNRPTLALAADSVLKVTDEIGLHPALKGFAGLLDAGQLAIVQGTGYDNPNRSHFESMDIWHTCQRKQDVRVDGWLGRFLEQTDQISGGDPRGIHLGADKQPFALMSRNVRVPSIRSLQQFRLEGADDERFRRTVSELAGSRRSVENDLLGFVQSSTSSAISASERIESSGRAFSPAVTYPTTGLGDKLKTVSQLISSELKTSIYYVQLDGFDTHAQQDGAHAGLLRQLGDAVHAFVSDMVAQGIGDRTLVMAFSEFGRRVAENASEGTDHGTAGPMFLAGSRVIPGLIGAHPDLNDLVDGDLRHHTDFRQVYAAVLEQWLGCRSAEVLKGRFDPVKAIATT